MSLDQLYEGLVEAYFLCRKNKRNKKSAQQFELNWSDKIMKLAEEIYNGVYKIGKSIAFVVNRPKWREIFAASFRDRIVHHWITRRLEPLFESIFIDDTYNCRKGKGTLYGIKRVHQMIKECSNNYTTDCWIGKFDMQSFFMSIHKPTLLNMITEFIEDNYFADDKELLLQLTTMVITNRPELNCEKHSPDWMWEHIPTSKSLFTNGEDYGLPIGNITSQMLANFYLYDFDNLMHKAFKYYGRYVDDFIIISSDKNKLLYSIPVMRNQLNRIQIKLHPDKIYFQHYTKGVSFIGSTSKMDRTYTGNRTIKNFIGTCKQYYKYNKNNAEQFICRLNSYLGYMIHHNTFAIRCRIMKQLFNKWGRYFRTPLQLNKVILRDKYKEIQHIKRIIKDIRNYGKNNRPKREISSY